MVRGRVVRQALVPSFVNQCFDMVNAGAVAEPSPNVAAVPRLDDGSSFLNLPRLYWGCRRELDMAINGRRNKPFGPGGSTRRLHPSPASTGFGGAELGSTRV